MVVIQKKKFERRFMTLLMKKGEFIKAERFFYKFINKLKTNGISNPYYVLRKAFIAIAPVMSIYTKKVRSKDFKYLKYLDQRTADKIAIKWFFEKVGKQKSAKLIEDMEKEVILAYKNKGDLIKKKTDLYKDVRFAVSKVKWKKSPNYVESKLQQIQRKRWF